MIRPAPPGRAFAAGAALFLVAAVFAVAPLPLAFRSAGIVAAAYLAFGFGGMGWAYVAALLAPPVGLFGGDPDWLVMLPVVLSGNLLAMLGLEYGWRALALVLSPALLIAPHLTTSLLSQRDLFRVVLPWEPGATAWIALHAAVAVAGVALALALDRRRA
ncbi:MAG: hypothetical protein RI554_03390 [Trueperaceae bacterium]|nr:hypothetical protein [Trueperaceae bacterium]